MQFDFIVDTREKYVMPQTLKLYPEAIPEALYAGDFAARENGKFLVGVERKELMDLIGSIQNKRLFKQIDKLHETYPIIILIIEGEMAALRATFPRLKNKRTGKQLEFKEGAFWGTLASVVVRDNIHIYHSLTMNETIHMAHNICTKIAEGKYQKVRRWKPKNKNTPLDLLKIIPGVTESVAKELLKKYGNVQNISMQTQKELCTNKSVGPAVAKNIKKYLC